MGKINGWVKGGLIALIIFASFRVCVARAEAIDESVLEAGSIELGGSGAFGYDDRQSISVFSLLPRGGMFFAKNAEAEVELPLMYIHTPDSEVPAFGVNINALYHINTGTPFVPFALLGIGAAYVAGDISETTSLTAMSQGGVGLKYFFSERAALRFEYRFRHFSDPFVSDAGIDSHSVLFGISFFPFP